MATCTPWRRSTRRRLAAADDAIAIAFRNEHAGLGDAITRLRLEARHLGRLLETIERFEGRCTNGTRLFGILHHKAQARLRLRGRDADAPQVIALY